MSVRAVPAMAESMEPPVEADAGAPAAGEALFVCALDLPTASLAKARAAVALQLDILSPLPTDEVVSSTVLMGPVEGGLTRFAVGLAPKSLFAAHAGAGARGPAALRLSGALDGQSIAFRFDNPYRAQARERAAQRRLSAAIAAGACAVLILGGASLRLQRENGAAQARADATSALVSQAVERTRGGGAAGWLAARSGNARLAECALKAVAGAGVDLADLTVADGAATVTFARPLSVDAVAALPRSAHPVAGSASDAGVSQVRIEACP